MADIADRIKAFNQDREAERLAIKYRLMRADPFVFLRGTCHLYYQDWYADLAKIDAPLGWISGDLHLENFGSFKGDNRLVNFDLNDFDEAVLAPASWELSRLMTSILVAAQTLSFNDKQALSLCKKLLRSYAASLIEGKAKWVERKTATGMIKSLLDPLRRRSRKAFLDSRTTVNKGQRQLIIDGKRALPIAQKSKDELLAFLSHFAAKKANPAFYRPLDIARRVAGTGSLGIARYVILIEGHGSPDENYLLDLKQASPSALMPYLAGMQSLQPAWKSEAERIVSIQSRMQAMPPAFLNAVNINGLSFLLKGLQPAEDRLNLDNSGKKMKRLGTVIETMGQVVAWGHLRSSGRQGSAIADDWIALGINADAWSQPLIALAQAAAKQTGAQWQTYAQAYDAGQFNQKVV